jgi:hypothetical protein
VSSEDERLVTDLEGALRTWVDTQPGQATYLANGVQLSTPRSPAQGAVSTCEVTGDAGSSNLADRRTVDFRVLAVGERGGRGQALAGAQWLARTLPKCRDQVVATPSGAEQVRLLAVVDVGGPLYSGNVGGRVQYTVSCTVVAQPA